MAAQYFGCGIKTSLLSIKRDCSRLSRDASFCPFIDFVCTIFNILYIDSVLQDCVLQLNFVEKTARLNQP